jgi:cytochrome bd-type quinol oxidase subunit 2
MSFSAKLASADRSSLLAQVMAFGMLVAILSASLALGNIVTGSYESAGAPPGLLAALQAEWYSVFEAWLVTVAAAMLVSAYVLARHSVASIRPTSELISRIGASPRRSATLLATRLLLVALGSLGLGLSLGLVAGQLAFRLVLVPTGDFLTVPQLGVGEVLVVAAFSFATVFLGGFAAFRRRAPA